jgi:hypothetical protein
MRPPVSRTYSSTTPEKRRSANSARPSKDWK